LKLGRDGWAGLAILIASLILFGLTLGLKGNPMVPIGPGFYPRIVLGITAALALWLLLADLLTRHKAAAPAAPVAGYGLVLAMFALFGLYVGALPALGFRVATFAYVAAVNALLDPPHALRAWARVALVGVITATVAYVAFEHYLLVLLPRGSWTGF
jgi:putative tricarboxylic transport membrane protein